MGLPAKTDFIQFCLPVFIRAGIVAEFPLATWYKSPHRHPERDTDRCPVGSRRELAEIPAYAPEGNDIKELVFFAL